MILYYRNVELFLVGSVWFRQSSSFAKLKQRHPPSLLIWLREVGRLFVESGSVYVRYGIKCLGKESIAGCLVSQIYCSLTFCNICLFSIFASFLVYFLFLIRVLLLDSLPGWLILRLRFEIFQTNSNNNLRQVDRCFARSKSINLCDWLKSHQFLKYPI